MYHVILSPKAHRFLAILAYYVVLQAAPATAYLLPGQTAPRFTLADLQGKWVDSALLSPRQLVILYFFDMDARSSLEGLSALNQLARQHRSEIAVYGVSASLRDQIVEYLRKSGMTLQVLLDTAQVRNLYHAHQLLPVACLIGEGGKVLEYFQGGGKGMEMSLSAAVRRELDKRRREAQPSSPAKGHAATPPKKSPQTVGRILDEKEF